MSKIKKALIIISVTVVLFVGIITLFVVNFKNDKKKTEATQEEVISEFTTFKDEIVAFSNRREIIYQEVLNTIFLDTLKDGYIDYTEKLNLYTEEVDNIEKVSKRLGKLCKNRIYPDSNVNNKCQAFTTLYEQSYNYYVSDIKRFNYSVQKYNETNEEKLELYKSKYNEYIDYNNDKMFLGIED